MVAMVLESRELSGRFGDPVLRILGCKASTNSDHAEENYLLAVAEDNDRGDCR